MVEPYGEGGDEGGEGEGEIGKGEEGQRQEEAQRDADDDQGQKTESRALTPGVISNFTENDVTTAQSYENDIMIHGIEEIFSLI